MITCPKCRCEQSKAEALLGQLGYIIHYRCRYCGGGWHVNLFPVRSYVRMGHELDHLTDEDGDSIASLGEES